MARTATAAPPRARFDTLRDRGVEVETPEHVAIGYELADLGSRFTALVLDGLILIGGLLVLWWGIPSFVDGLGGLPAVLEGTGTAILIALTFLWTWGYFVYFEGFRDGQTPGKKRVGIRAVHDGGYPLTFRGAAVRNLLRLVDAQPAFSWLLGGLAMMWHPQTKRLGDMAAGSVVVRERAGTTLPEEAGEQAEAAGPPRLTAPEWDALTRYVLRRGALEPAVRANVARKLGQHMVRHYADDPRLRALSADDFLLLVHGEESARRAAAGSSGRAGTAQASGLVRRQRSTWDEYRALLEQARKRGLDRLAEPEVSRFAALYREVAADLARARTYGGSPELVYTLERAVGAGHNLLYRPEQRSWRVVKRWITAGFPALVRRRWRPVLAATALFYLPAVLAFTAVRTVPETERELVHPVLMARAEEAGEKEARGEGYVEVPEVMMPALASSLISNNVQVTFLAFAGGVLAGLGTTWVLLMNGVMLGGVAGAFANRGASMHLWSFVLPHGVVELTAICIAGGAGLWLGSAFLLPGRLTRRQALVVRGREAVSLIGGTAMMLVIAGMIEGFISPSELPRPAKLAFAGVIGVLMLAYLLLAGRDEEGRRSADETAGR